MTIEYRFDGALVASASIALALVAGPGCVSGTPYQRALTLQGNKASGDEIMKSLEDPNWKLRCFAASACSHRNDLDCTAEFFRRATLDTSKEVHSCAVIALANRCDQESTAMVATLARALTSGDFEDAAVSACRSADAVLALAQAARGAPVLAALHLAQAEPPPGQERLNWLRSLSELPEPHFEVERHIADAEKWNKNAATAAIAAQEENDRVDAATGGGAATAAGTGSLGLLEDATTLSWLTYDGSRLKVRKALKSGTSSADVADLPYPSDKPAMIASGDWLYVAADNQVYKISNLGGTTTVLATPIGVGVDEDIGIAGSTLVWLSPDGTSVWKMPIDGGAAEKFAPNETKAYDLVASGNMVCWMRDWWNRGGVIAYDLNEGKVSEFPSSVLSQGLSINSNTISWLQYDTVVWTKVGATTASSLKLDPYLKAATFDGVKTLFVVSEYKGNTNSTGLHAINTDDGMGTYERATGQSSIGGGIATEVPADSNNVYFVVQKWILRRARR